MGESIIDPTSIELLRAWLYQKDTRALETFFDRYIGRLLEILRQRISPKLRRRLDPEDIVQSACRSFVVRILDGRIDIEASDAPGRLLITIVMRKLKRQFQTHLAAGKRSINREVELGAPDNSGEFPAEPVSPEPGPEALAAVADEINAVIDQFPPRHRDVIHLHLDGCPVSEIAHIVNRCDRTVRDVLKEFERRCERRFSQCDD